MGGTVSPTERGRWKGETFVFHVRTPVARKRHECDACGEPIEAGERYVTYVTRGLEGPGWEHWRAHGECYVDGVPLFSGERPTWRWHGEVEAGPVARRCRGLRRTIRLDRGEG